MNLLYCNSAGLVLATHEAGQGVPASAYGDGVSIVPWDDLSTLLRFGTAPAARADGRPLPDMRPFILPAALTEAELSSYASYRQSVAAQGGLTVNVAASGAPAQNVRVNTTQGDLTNYTGLYLLAAGNAAYTTNWVNADGTSLTLTAAQIATVATSASGLVQASFGTLAAVNAAIAAGTVTTLAEIDAAAWPSNA
jgi:hypothetical protein